ncbi:hypothetical protein PSHT_12262 [Puccinia striiformis]|uniref:NADP-dependent oxidoreductase domain-containing protein n=1 Tax=Puccinia striiformis TaxID=27350 RepID=A0A2S4UXJ4_9BASI|nr:hypothetical protein PSHT_12262 [Puccinia striiformis]
MSTDSPLRLSSIIFGGATFSKLYNSDDELKKNTPESTLLFAFRNGINAIDTSPYYGNSESTIGQIIGKPEFQAEFPRSSYHLLTKCGRYGSNIQDFDYSPERIVKSVKEGCKLMCTDYLDVVYLHDVEFVAEDPQHFTKGGQCKVSIVEQNPRLDPEPAVGSYAQSFGPGDDTVLRAVKTLFHLKEQGLIRRVGISGYPLGTLLRISHLIKAELGNPLDIVMSYASLNLQNSALEYYLPYFEATGVKQIISASPFAMGLLTGREPQEWHPAPEGLRQVIKDVRQTVKSNHNISLERLALLYASYFPHTVVGFSSVEEVKTGLDVFNQLQDPKDQNHVSQAQATVKEALQKSGFLNWSWPSPPIDWHL